MPHWTSIRVRPAPSRVVMLGERLGTATLPVDPRQTKAQLCS